MDEKQNVDCHRAPPGDDRAIELANIIFVVKDQKLAERGTHDELLAAGGFFAELYHIQHGEPVILAHSDASGGTP